MRVRGRGQKLMKSLDGLVNYYGVFVPQLHELRGSSDCTSSRISFDHFFS